MYLESLEVVSCRKKGYTRKGITSHSGVCNLCCQEYCSKLLKCVVLECCYSKSTSHVYEYHYHHAIIDVSYKRGFRTRGTGEL